MNLFIFTVISLCTFSASISATVIRQRRQISTEKTNSDRELYVTAPSTIRLGSDENIAVAIEGETSLRIDVTITDSLENNIFQQIDSVVSPGTPQLFKFRLDPSEFYERTILAKSKFVDILVHSKEFNKKITVPVVFDTGFVFIQTDRPIYSPEQKAFLRIVSLNDYALPSGESFKLQIRNPQDILVEETLFNEPKRAFVNHSYEFPKQSPLGEWKARVLYGYKFEQSTSTRFDLSEYVLPTFTVNIETPNYIFPDTNVIQIHIHARSVYGKKVDGSASLSIRLPKPGNETGNIRKTFNSLQLVNGSYTLNLNITEMLPTKAQWLLHHFSNLVVEAEVLEKATGIKKNIMNDKCIFIARRLQVQIRNTPTCFKPGINFPVEVLILNEARRPVSGIPVILEGKVNDKWKLNTIEKFHISDQNGIVYFRIRTKTRNTKIFLKVITNSTTYERTENTFEIQKCNSDHNPSYIAIQRTRTNKFKVGDTISRQIYFEPSGFQKAYLTVSSKGKIISQETIWKEEKSTMVEIPVTRDMVPSARITVFAMYENDLVADSLKIDTEGLCQSTKEVSIHSQFDNKEPGAGGKIVLRGMPNTLVGLLGVDQAIYALSKKDILNTSKVIQTLDSHDLGTDLQSNSEAYDTLKKAGLIIATYLDEDVASYDDDVPEDDEGFIDNLSSPKSIDKPIPKVNLKKHHITDENVRYLERALKVRNDFRETWLFQDLLIGSEGEEKYDVTLPDSITTWNIQAISVSHEDGLCISKPQSLISTKKIFLQLNLPKSVKKNEQILIPATLFNYGPKQIAAIISINGSEHLRVTDGEKTQRREERISIDSGSAATVTFAVTPLEEGKVRVNVTAITDDGSDAISRILNVRHEDFLKIVEHTIPISPGSQQNRTSSLVYSTTTDVGIVTETFNVIQKTHDIGIKLKFPKNFFPGSEKCELSAIGDQYGTAVETALSDPARFLRMPYGCGEQNVMFLAPTLYALNYLTAVNKLTPGIKAKGHKYIKKGFTTQLLYRNRDGYFSSFQNFPPNLWLTAYVLKVFCQAKKVISIDEVVMRTGINWLLETQQPDGSFNEIHPLYHTDMTNGTLGNIPLTAHVLITLEECSAKDLHKEFDMKRLNAINHIEKNIDKVQNPLHLAIVAYALALSNSPNKNTTYEKLCANATYDEERNFMYWDVPEKSARTIEATSYALLTSLHFGDRNRANSIVNWLKTQQLKSGSYKSSQDTVVTLQALSVYAKQTKTPKIDLALRVVSPHQENVQQITINNNNMRTLQKLELNNPRKEFHVVATGHGSGILFVSCSYLVNKTADANCKFKVNVTVTEELDASESPCSASDFNKDKMPVLIKNGDVFQTKGGNVFPNQEPPLADDGDVGVKVDNKQRSDKFILKISVCARYLEKDPVEMSIVDVGIFSGFKPLEEDLEKLKNCGNIQWYDIYGYGVIFYLKTIPSGEDYCFHFHVARDVCVNNVQKSMAKVYDYYNPDQVCTTFYEPGELVCPPIGGCPPENPLKDFKKYTLTERSIRLKDHICHNFDFAWIVESECGITEESKLHGISFKIKEVIKNDIGNSSSLEEETVFLFAAKSCNITQYQKCKATYLFMGKSTQITGLSERKIRYALDEKSFLVEVVDSEQEVVIDSVKLKMVKEGCGCPVLTTNFSDFSPKPDTRDLQNCREFDILWIAKLLCEDRKIENGYYTLNFEIIEVFIEGEEKGTDVVGKNVTFLIENKCHVHMLRSCKNYMIVSKDGEKYGGSDFRIQYRYVLTEKSELIPMDETNNILFEKMKGLPFSQTKWSKIKRCES